MQATIASTTTKTQPLLGYRLAQLIGKGGCGEVWRALSPAGKSVAVKFLRCNGAQTVNRELRALQSIRQLCHPHLINTLEIWADSGRVAVAMELAEGSLLDLLHVSMETEGRPLPPEHICFLLRQAARALDFLNTRQHMLNGRRVAVRHCDVKPSNLLLFSTVVKVADFGFAVQTAAPIGAYERIGTLNYAAPEVFQGLLSDRTDQYALAVTYCQLRSGSYPFPDTPPDFYRHYVRPAPDLSKLSEKEVPIIARALYPIPQNRWPSCTEMMDRLEQALGIEKPASDG
jgi:serine/threonine protein kinase